jgi:hypothetical protein
MDADASEMQHVGAARYTGALHVFGIIPELITRALRDQQQKPVIHNSRKEPATAAHTTINQGTRLARYKNGYFW